MKKKKRIAVISLLILVLSFTGCLNAESAQGENGEFMQNYRVSLYYANSEYVKNADENLPKMNQPLMVKIKSTPTNIYQDVISYLKQAPNDSNAVTFIPEDLVVNSIVVADGTATVDISSKDLNGGSMQETFFIGQIVNSLLQSFGEIDRVQFLVDGQIPETLMGHIMAQDPFTWQD